MKVYIKNMVCCGTKYFVLLEIEKLGIKYNRFELGEIDLEDDLKLREIKKLDSALRNYGMEIMFRKNKLVSKIRNTVLDMVENNINPVSGFSFYISNRLGSEYDYLNSYFSKETGLPIEEYYIEKKDEKMRGNETEWPGEYHHLNKSA